MLPLPTGACVSVHTHDRQEEKKEEEKGNGDW